MTVKIGDKVRVRGSVHYPQIGKIISVNNLTNYCLVLYENGDREWSVLYSLEAAGTA